MTDTILDFLPSLLISLLAVAIFLYLARQNRAQIDRLKENLRRSSELSVEHFLERESSEALRRIQSASAGRANDAPAPPDPARRLVHMRRCWLEAELRALVDHGRAGSDYAALRDAAMPLLRLVERTEAGGAAATPAWNDKTSQEYLQRTRDAVASQRQFIQEFKARTAKLGTKSAASTGGSEPPKAAMSGLATSVGHMESNTADLLRTIERLERELAAAQTKYDMVKGRLTALEAIRATRSAASQAASRVATTRTPEQAGQDRALLDDMESAYLNSINEMKKMSEINRQQRQLILQMEKELALVRKDTHEHQAAAAVLEKMKLQLRDYENCTTILEMESDTLREQIQDLRRAIGNGDATAAPAPAAQPAHPQPDRGDWLQLMSRIAGSATLELAGQQLLGWLDEQNIASVIFIKGAQEAIWLSSEGRVDDHSKQLLKSMVPVAGQPISEVREGVMFIYATCRVLLYGKGDFHERGSASQLMLRDTFAAADAILQLFQDRMDLAQHHQQRARLQQKIQSLLVQYNYIDSEFTRALAAFRQELEGYLATADLTEVQRQCIDTMLADFDSQLDILSKTGKLVANGLKVSVQDLAKIEQASSA